jgi:hypothetical protein
MPELGNSRLELILSRYYHEGLGGVENWEKIVSLRVSGILTLEGGEFQLHAYQKKPDFVKMTIIGDNRDLVIGYDGKTAWRLLRESNAVAKPMEQGEARRFIHSAHFGNHLLYPYAFGKTISYIDTVPVEGRICHQIRVTLDTDYQVDYFIDVRTYLEIRVNNLDLRSGERNAVVYEDYIREFGMPIAKKVVSTKNDNWVSTLVLEEVKVNSGIMPWMFRMPD